MGLMKIEAKEFKELTLDELYEVLRLRTEVFVVEQDCVYQDIDNKDQKAIHIIGWEGDEIVAYTRIFKPGVYFKEAAIGRVLVAHTHRNKGLAHQLLAESIREIKNRYQSDCIKISAQTYLLDFYSSHGFKAEGEPYLEDGIPHRAMRFTSF